MPLRDPSSWSAWTYALGLAASSILASLGTLAGLSRKAKKDMAQIDLASTTGQQEAIRSLMKQVSDLHLRLTETHESYQRQYRTMEEHWQMRLGLQETELKSTKAALAKANDRCTRLEEQIRELETRANG
ncbi:MAG: hypothetical protein LAT50_12130 [Ectothiorhodospiraceae bacterium]|nr:hypothetical protein [Ectothiorhodospiraceae bacterium]